MESYVAGLRDDSDIGQAWADQFSTGEPGYSVGLQYEIPICNRAARARLQRRRLELRQLRNQFRTTVETLRMETKVAAREVRTSDREFKAKYHSMQAAAKRLDNIEQRWAALPGVETSIGLYLDDVLAAQQQLADAEYEFAKSETTYNLALMNLKRATGMLLQHEQVVGGVADVEGLPTRVLDKATMPSVSTGFDFFQSSSATGDFEYSANTVGIDNRQNSSSPRVSNQRYPALSSETSHR